MKVILLEDIKNKGKKYEIKDFTNGYANFLIKDKKALIANETNLSALQELQAKLQAELMSKATAVTNMIHEAESLEIIFIRALTPKGTLAKAVTKKEILEAVNNKLTTGQLNIKDLYTNNIKNTGSFYVGVSVPLGDGTRITGNLTVTVKSDI